MDMLQKQIVDLKKSNEEMKNHHLEQIKQYEKELRLIISQYYVLMSDKETFDTNDVAVIKEKTAFKIDCIIQYMDFLHDINNKSFKLIEILDDIRRKRD